MANTTAEDGACPPPFFQLSRFAATGGYLEGRICAPVLSLQGTIECCLPCPIADWVYNDHFKSEMAVTNWLNVAGVVCSISLLISFLVLPVQTTHRHYLTVCLVLGVILIQLGFIVPLGANPQECHDSITPNDMHSDFTCAFSGACILLGAWSTIMWVFLRSLSLHLQICWEVITGRKFFYGSLLVGWGVPIACMSLALGVTGVSYRFGDTCHINQERALQDFFGPLLAFAALAAIFQFATFGYCIRVYINSLLQDNPQSDVSSGLPTYSGSMKTVTARAAYRRVRKVIELQWRGMVIVLINVANVVFFSVVFVTLDKVEGGKASLLPQARPWLLCLAMNPTNKDACLGKTKGLVVDPHTVLAVLVILSLNGLWALLFLGRWSMVPAWGKLLQRTFTRSHDFVSVDARRYSADPRTYELLGSPSIASPPAAKIPGLEIKSLNADIETGGSFSPNYLQTAKQDYISKLTPASEQDYFDSGNKPQSPEARYLTPSLSFSTPRAPSAGRGVVKIAGKAYPIWDPRSTHARGRDLAPGKI